MRLLLLTLDMFDTSRYLSINQSFNYRYFGMHLLLLLHIIAYIIVIL